LTSCHSPVEMMKYCHAASACALTLDDFPVVPRQRIAEMLDLSRWRIIL
jgi:hypothetical protein